MKKIKLIIASSIATALLSGCVTDNTESLYRVGKAVVTINKGSISDSKLEELEKIDGIVTQVHETKETLIDIKDLKSKDVKSSLTQTQ